MRSFGHAVLTVAGVVTVLGFIGSVAAAIAAWTSTRCSSEGLALGIGVYCVRTGYAARLTHSPWTYLALGMGLFLLAVCIFTARERIRPAES